MPLNPGTRIGPYEVTGPLGAGGMGEVYRARDSRLGRDVAIKVLPDLFSGDPDRLARFEREAHLLASLQHPRIAVVYGVEEMRGQRALVMELVEGETLADRLAQGPLPVDDAIGIARQIADALEAAHEKGIVHRDLKPANIKLRLDGEIKVLDFGLAKAISPVGAGSGLANSPTVSIGTQAGIVLGTAAYMSPEQARGRPVDRRTDVWAFGCVLYEMLTGKSAFGGESVTDLIAAIVKEDPAWAQLPPDVPPGVRRLLQRCLRKDARQRLRDMGDVRLELDEAQIEPAAAPVPVRDSRSRWTLPALGAGAAILGLGALALAWTLTRPAPADTPVRFALDMPKSEEITIDMRAAMLSPDGSQVVFTVGGQNQSRLMLRPLDRMEATPVAGTADGFNPFFSPDGRWIAFTARGKLCKVPVEGGTALTLAEAAWGGGDWARDGTIVYTRHYTEGIWRIDAAGGTATQLTKPDSGKGELGHFWPQFLPDGKHIIFTAFSAPLERSKIVAYSLASGERTDVVDGAVYGRYLASGHLVFMRAESMVAAPFDPDRRKLTGGAVALAEKVAISSPNGLAQLDVAANGTLVYVPDLPASGETEVVWLDQKGTISPALPMRRRFYDAALSPDGNHVALTIVDRTRDLWTYDFTRGLLTRITSGPANNFGAIWSADGRQLLYVSERPVFNLYRKAPTPGAAEEPLVTEPYDTTPAALTGDGRTLVHHQDHPGTRHDIWMRPLDGTGKPTPFVQTKADEDRARLSPDGRWLAYDSDESGNREVYVRAFPAGGEPHQVSLDGGAAPRWSRDGRLLYFVTKDHLMAASMTTTPPFARDKPTSVFQSGFRMMDYEVASDGRILMIRRPADATPDRINVVLNWFSDLRKRVSR